MNSSSNENDKTRRAMEERKRNLTYADGDKYRRPWVNILKYDYNFRNTFHFGIVSIESMSKEEMEETFRAQLSRRFPFVRVSDQSAVPMNGIDLYLVRDVMYNVLGRYVIKDYSTGIRKDNPTILRGEADQEVSMYRGVGFALTLAEANSRSANHFARNVAGHFNAHMGKRNYFTLGKMSEANAGTGPRTLAMKKLLGAAKIRLMNHPIIRKLENERQNPEANDGELQ